MTEQIKQKTIKNELTIEGIGLHSGKSVQMTLKPAPENTGIIFYRTDVEDKDNQIFAKWDCVVDTRMNTCIGNASGVIVSTVEHFMGALAALGITNLIVHISAPDTNPTPTIAPIAKNKILIKFIIFFSVSRKKYSRAVEKTFCFLF